MIIVILLLASGINYATYVADTFDKEAVKATLVKEAKNLATFDEYKHLNRRIFAGGVWLFNYNHRYLRNINTYAGRNISIVHKLIK